MLKDLWPRSVQAHLIADAGTAATGNGRFRSLEPPVRVHLAFPNGQVPHGLCEIIYAAGANAGVIEPCLEIVPSDPSHAAIEVAMRAAGARAVRFVCRIPGRPRALALAFPHATSVALGHFEIREIGRVRAGTNVARRVLATEQLRPGRLGAGARGAFGLWRAHGIAGLKAAALRRQHRVDYEAWRDHYAVLSAQDRQLIAQRVASLADPPLISVLMPTYETPLAFLERAVGSVRNQLYPYWELCIADDASTNPQVVRSLRSWAKEERRIKVTQRSQRGHIAAASNSALALASGSYIALLDHDDELAPDALFWVAEDIMAHPDAEIIYTDEDKIDAQGAHREPYFKCDWNPDLALAQNYLAHLCVMRTALVRAVGGFREGLEGAQDHDLVLRIIDGAPPHAIRHIPRVLYHWRAHERSTAAVAQAKSYAAQNGRRAVSEHLDRGGIRAEVLPVPGLDGMHRVRYALPEPCPLVSIIILTRDGLDVLEVAITSIRERTDYPRLELIVVDNGSREPRTLTYLKGLSSLGTPSVRVLRDDRAFNFSALNNRAVGAARGALLCFVNNDIEVIEGDWMREMASHAVRTGIGAVGARLLYPDRTLQHGGVILGLGGVAGHAHKHFPSAHAGYFGRAALVSQFSAVTGACLMVRRDLFQAVGGFDEDLAISFNDIDLCLGLNGKGFRTIWTPHATLIHHESRTRGSDETLEKRRRLAHEAAIMEWRWGSLLRNDPAYSPNLTLSREDFGLAQPPRVPTVGNYLKAQGGRNPDH